MKTALEIMTSHLCATWEFKFDHDMKSLHGHCTLTNFTQITRDYHGNPLQTAIYLDNIMENQTAICLDIRWKSPRRRANLCDSRLQIENARTVTERLTLQ